MSLREVLYDDPLDPLYRPVPLWGGEIAREIFVEPGGRVDNWYRSSGPDFSCCTYPGEDR